MCVVRGWDSFVVEGFAFKCWVRVYSHRRPGRIFHLPCCVDGVSFEKGRVSLGDVKVRDQRKDKFLVCGRGLKRGILAKKGLALLHVTQPLQPAGAFFIASFHLSTMLSRKLSQVRSDLLRREDLKLSGATSSESTLRSVLPFGKTFSVTYFVILMIPCDLCLVYQGNAREFRYECYLYW
jgi:hypothetical protein